MNMTLNVPRELRDAKCAVCSHCGEGFLVFRSMTQEETGRFIAWSHRHTKETCPYPGAFASISSATLVIMALTEAPSH
jgi:hypothetical protein